MNFNGHFLPKVLLPLAMLSAGLCFAADDQPPAEIWDKIYAVHATDIVPAERVLKPGAISSRAARTSGQVQEYPDFRPTVHFALGELVRSHATGNWEERKLAIVVPFRAIEPQLQSVDAIDTTVIGDFRIPRDAIFVTTQEFAGKIPYDARFVIFDPKTSSLRQAVDQVIQRLGGVKIELGSTLGAEAHLDGKNINTEEFFSPILKKHSHVSFGSPVLAQTRGGDRTHAIGEMVSELITQQYQYGNYRATERVEGCLTLIKIMLAEVDRTFAEANLPEPARIGFARKRNELKGWMNMMEADLYIRNKYGRVADVGIESVREDFFALRDQLGGLHSFMDRIAGSRFSQPIKDKVPEAGLYAYLDLAIRLKTEPPATANRYIASLAVSPEVQDAMQTTYAAARILRIGTVKANDEGLMRIVKERLSASLRHEGAPETTLDKVRDRIWTYAKGFPSHFTRTDGLEWIRPLVDPTYKAEKPCLAPLLRTVMNQVH